MTDREAVLLKIRAAMRFRADRARWGLGRATAEEGRVEQAATSHRLKGEIRWILRDLEAEGLVAWDVRHILTRAGLEVAASVSLRLE